MKHRCSSFHELLAWLTYQAFFCTRSNSFVSGISACFRVQNLCLLRCGVLQPPPLDCPIVCLVSVWQGAGGCPALPRLIELHAGFRLPVGFGKGFSVQITLLRVTVCGIHFSYRSIQLGVTVRTEEIPALLVWDILEIVMRTTWAWSPASPAAVCCLYHNVLMGDLLAAHGRCECHSSDQSRPTDGPATLENNRNWEKTLVSFYNKSNGLRASSGFVPGEQQAQGTRERWQETLLLPNHYCTQQQGSYSQGNNEFATCISRLHPRSLSLAHRSSSLPITAGVPDRKQKSELPLTFSLPPFFFTFIN